MSALALLTELHAVGIRLEAKAGRLRVDAPAGVVTDEIRQQLRQSKDDLLALLTEPTEPCSDCDGTDFRFVGGFWWCQSCDAFDEINKLAPDEMLQVAAIKKAFGATVLPPQPEPTDFGTTAYGAALVATYRRERI